MSELLLSNDIYQISDILKYIFFLITAIMILCFCCNFCVAFFITGVDFGPFNKLRPRPIL